MTAHVFLSIMRRRRAAQTGAALALLALAGCGFHLQGGSPVPEGISSMHVAYSSNYRVGDPPLVTALKQRLRQQRLLGDTDAPARLDVVKVNNSRRLVSVSPIDGGAAEYAVTTQVKFNYSVNGAERLSDETLSTTRNYTVSATQRLSSQGERRQLRSQMQQNLADIIFARIARANQVSDRPSKADG